MGGPATIGGQRLASTSNFLIQPMQIDGVLVRASTGEHSATPLEWKSVEHYFQAAKFDAIAGRMSVWQHCRAIQLVNDPLEAWELGQSRKHPLRADWEDVKAHTMYLGVVAKYKACPEHARVNGAPPRIFHRVRRRLWSTWQHRTPSTMKEKKGADGTTTTTTIPQ
eukprot:scaffold6761_cov159-Amphora_coffeaeformis.AAC.11